ncbi:MAG TPA: TonB-dependent receptor plug domain-containing protein, partial [Nevskiaceae bacterium]|nr:TonB-dependent receptor plug domain-containing protein [Nevskiaceae bacterium]
MSAFRPSLWTSALSALLAAPALAQPAAAPAAPAVELEPVVITANPFGRDADEVVQPVDVLGGETLERQRRATLGETLEGQLGVSSSDFGPGVGRPVIRGQAGARVAVLENGIGTLDASTVSADHAVGLDPAHAEQIEIFKGPATLMFGSNAAAGVVNVVTARVPDAPVEGIEGLAETSYSGNASERLQRAQVRFGGGGLVVGGDIATRRAGDFEIPGFAESAALRAAEAEAGGEGEEAEAFGRLPNSALSADSGSVYGGWVRPGLKASAALSVLQTDYGIPGGHGHHGEAEAEADAEGEEEGGVRIDLRQVRSDLGLDLANPFAGFERLRARLGHNDYQHTELEPGGEAGTVYTNRETESRLELTHAPRAGWRGVAG